MGITNAQVVEQFLTGTVSTRRTILTNSTDTFKCVVKNNKRNLYSYNTLIAVYDLDKKLVLLTDSGLTPTTSKHRGEVLSALFKHNIKGYQVPIKINQDTLPTFDELLGRFEARMNKLSMGTDLALADNREAFTRNYNLYNELIEVSGVTPTNKAKYDDLAMKIEDVEYLKKIQRERRQFMTNKAKVYTETISNKEYFN